MPAWAQPYHLAERWHCTPWEAEAAPLRYAMEQAEYDRIKRFVFDTQQE